MALAERKQKILSSVIENYIAFGEPVGSKTLLSNTDLNCSSATIRNELADLASEGYLFQPHTSAGRAPTQKGYRYYIDNLMPKVTLPERMSEYIESIILSGANAPETILSKTAHALSLVSDMAAVVTSPPSQNARVHRIRFVATGRHTSMAVLITSNGMVKSKLFRCEFVLTPELLSMFDKALNEKFSGVKLTDINKVFLQTVAGNLGELTLFMPDVLLAVYEAAQDALIPSVTVCGETNLLFLDGYNLYSARNVLKFLSKTDDISRLLNQNVGDTKIILGDESGRYELCDSSVITTRYEISGEKAGAVALLGPVRVDYKMLVAQIEFASACASKLICELLEQ